MSFAKRQIYVGYTKSTFLMSFLLIASLTIYIITYFPEPNLTNNVKQYGGEMYENREQLPKLSSLKKHKIENSISCLDIKDIGHLMVIFENYRNLLNNSTKRWCHHVSHLIDILFRIELSKGSDIIIPSQMEEMIRTNWLRNDKNLFNSFLHPKTLTITNRWTFETTGINPLRALRPRQNNAADSLNYTLNAINQSRKGCNFCNKNYTIMDPFGRIELPKLGLYSAHNAFQYIDPVGLFIPGTIHNWMKVLFVDYR